MSMPPEAPPPEEAPVRSHPVALLGFAGRLLAVLGMVGALASTLLGFAPAVMEVWLGVVLVGVALMVLSYAAAAFDVPRGSARAEDELVRWSETRSYTCGYWTTLAVFLILLWAVRRDAVSAEAAFGALGLPLGFAPIVFMIVAFLRGRAG